MTYFTGIDWVDAGHIPNCRAWVDKHFIDYCCLNFAAKGELTWRIDRGRTVTLKTPVAWWTFPGPLFQYGSKNGVSWDHYYACFRGPRMADFIRKGLLPTSTKRPWKTISDPGAFRWDFENLLRQWKDITHRPQRRIHILEGLLLHLVEQPTAVRHEDLKDQQIRLLAHEIRQCPQKNWDFAAEAKNSGLSCTHFYRLFKKVTRLAPHQFTIQARLEIAAKLLREDTAPIKVVAEAAGVPDIYYFTRIFKRHFGSPPSRYRKEQAWGEEETPSSL